MIEKYTIEKQGEKWIASNGQRHVEADGPDEALYLLTVGEISEESSGEDVADGDIEAMRLSEIELRVGNAATRLIRLLAISAVAADRVPCDLIQSTADLIASSVTQYLDLWGRE